MANLIREGFGFYSGNVDTTGGLLGLDTRWTTVRGSGAIYSATNSGDGRRGGRGLRNKGTNTSTSFSYDVLTLLTEYVTLTMGVAIFVETSASRLSDYPSLGWRNSAGSSQLTLEPLATNAFNIRTGGITGSIIATSDPSAIRKGEWQYWVFQITCGSSGSIKVWVDDVLIIDASGVNTQGVGSGGINKIYFSNWNGIASSGQNTLYDDLYINDNTGVAPWNGSLGDMAIADLLPTADGADLDFTRSDATVDHYENIFTIGTSYADKYVESSTVGHRIGYMVTPPSGTPYIAGFEAVAYIANPSAGNAKARAYAKIGGIRYYGTESINLSNTPTQRANHFWPLNPATGSIWTEAVIAATEFGFETTEIS